MIPNYTPPRLTIDQVLDILPQETADRLTAVLVGPQYFLQRHTEGEATAFEFAGSNTVLDYTGAESNHILDTDFTRIHGVALEARLGILPESEADSFKILSVSEPNVIHYGGGSVAGPNRDDDFFHGRDIKVGDIFRVGPDDTDLRKRRVVALRGVTTAATPNSGTPGVVEPVGTPGTDNSGDLTVSGTYTGPKDTIYIIEVTAIDNDVVTEVRITDSAGIDATQIAVADDDTTVNLGELGLELTFADGGTLSSGWAVGDKYTVAATAESESNEDFDKVVLDGPAVLNPATDVDVYVDYRMEVSTEIDRKDVASAGDWAWDNGTITDGLSLTPQLRYTVPERTSDERVEFVSAVNETGNNGRLYLTFRSLVPRESGESYVTVRDLIEASEHFGVTDSPDNPLGYALRVALQGSAGKAVHAVRLAENTSEDYAAVRTMLRDIDAFYVFVPLSTDATVHQDFSEAMTASSTRTVMNWRSAYLGVDSPSSWAYLTQQSDGSPYTGTILEHNGEHVLFRTENLDLLQEEVVAGDIVRIQFSTDAWGDTTYQEYVIETVLNNSDAILKSGPASELTVPIKVEIHKDSSPSSIAKFLTGRASALASRRATQIWIDHGRVMTPDGLRTVSNVFLAAYLAGLRSSLLPQQGLSRFDVEFLHSAPSMYAKFNDTVLDNIAANGTFIVTQRITGGPVYVRHQLTTDTNRGALYYEDSVRVNVDMVAYELRDAIRPYIGRRNANRETLIDIRNALHNILESKTTISTEFADIGPALISYEILKLEIDTSLPDRIKVVIRLTVPLPLNRVDIVLGIGALTAEDIEDLDLAIAA